MKEPVIRLAGPAVEVPDMLLARDGRAAAQKKLLERYHRPLLFFTQNIPGPVKTSVLIHLGFLEGIRRLEKALEKAGIPILFQKTIDWKTGYEKYYVLDGNALAIKKIACAIEGQDRLGRLYDMDVRAEDGHKISRTDIGLPGRLCLICSQPAQACARSRKHSVPVLVRNVHRVLGDFLMDRVEDALRQGLQGEVDATPKPGLVDRDNPGAHRDMDWHTFARSTDAIVPHLRQMGEKGWDWEGTGEALFAALRPMGAAAEKAMFRATGNVNTHKGIIFSLGLVTSFTLWHLARTGKVESEAVLREIGEAVTPLLERDFARIDRYHPHTHGEVLYVEQGCRGIRGEAMDGFPAVARIALPALRRFRQEGRPDNEAYIQTLLLLLSQVEDTNILSRSDAATLRQAQEDARAVLDRGGAFTPEGIQAVWDLNASFVEKNISPGGCADLLILAIFLEKMEGLGPADR